MQATWHALQPIHLVISLIHLLPLFTLPLALLLLMFAGFLDVAQEGLVLRNMGIRVAYTWCQVVGSGTVGNTLITKAPGHTNYFNFLAIHCHGHTDTGHSNFAGDGTTNGFNHHIITVLTPIFWASFGEMLANIRAEISAKVGQLRVTAPLW